MKAVIKLDVPDFQIGQPVVVYFKDTMRKEGICELETVGYATEILRRHGWEESR